MKRPSGLHRVMVFLYGQTQRMAIRRNRKRYANERGQVMTEYVVVLLLAVLPLIAYGFAMHAAFGRYLSGIYFMVGLPIP